MTSLLYDLGALPYDLLTTQDAWRESCRRMASLLPHDFRPEIGLDLGCGPAVSAIEMARSYPGTRWLGADVSLPMLARARKNLAAERFPEGVRAPALLAADALALPLRSASVDVVTAHSLLYLLPSRLAGLAEIRRVLRPGGALVYLEPEQRISPLRIARHVAASIRAPRFALSMVAWQGMALTRPRVSQEGSRALCAAAGLRDAATHATLGGLGYFVVARG